MFRKVGSKIDFPRMEQDILRFWKEHDVFGESVEERRGGQHYTFYEGPPTANGSPGIHHVLSRLFKDVICRYKTMKGYHVPRKAGWDTHGLPVELEVESALGISSKAQIEKYGIARFNQLCRESVFRYIKEWEDLTERTGCWLDMEHPYTTLDNDYIESCWWALKRIWDKDWVYQGYKVTPHCPRCGTSLSSHEVALGYRDDTEDPSVYVKFSVPEEGVSGHLSKLGADRRLPTYLLAWTTTPWTLPGNTALAVAPEADYAFVKVSMDSGGEQLILAEALLGRALIGEYEVLGICKGKELVGERLQGKGTEYEPLYRLPGQLYSRLGFVFVGAEAGGPGGLVRESPSKGENFGLIAEDFVSLDEGTGIVHVAPAFGEVDYRAGCSQGLYFVQPVDEQGIMRGDPSFEGNFVKDADPLILKDLKSRGLLYRSERITHTYPFCWRCGAPLLYYAKQAWYIKTTAVKDTLIAGNGEINWYPAYIKDGRFGDWLENNVDWAFSRERYWGTPLNIWSCGSCGNLECVGSIAELRAKPSLYGGDTLVDLHRPYVDGITFACSKCGGEMRRVPEVIDCWFDSGAMPIGQWHYPFENGDKFEQNFPADFVCEAVDQTRGWFYSLHAISTLLFDQPCFKNVICLGHVVDACGEKMSKSKGNVIDPWTVINDYGADALRWYMLASVPGENVHRFATAEVARTMRDFLSTLWNTYSFFTIYANIDHFIPQPSGSVSLSELDNWIISELNRLIAEVTKSLDNYNPTLAARQIGSFVHDLSNWYVRRSRRRFWKSEEDADKLAAYNTLYQCLVTVSRLLAPFTPFIAEELYQNLVRSVDSKAKVSVHLTDFPTADEDKIVDKLSRDIALAMKVSSLGRAARASAGIKVRQPLGKAVIKVESEEEEETLGRLTAQILEEINVKQVEFSREESPPEVSSAYSVASDARHWVATSTELTPQLIAEGMSREIVRRLQNMRRAANFDIADRIVTYYQAKEPVKQAMVDFADYIKQETLSQELVDGVPPKEAYTEKLRISQCEVVFGVKLC
ncbi:MAG: isoleucine--tRNA ligase [Chloroflexi bacterium]|nr:isoleucine--tRNA ligase [Chloroflexota bacterium]